MNLNTKRDKKEHSSRAGQQREVCCSKYGTERTNAVIGGLGELDMRIEEGAASLCDMRENEILDLAIHGRLANKQGRKRGHKKAPVEKKPTPLCSSPPTLPSSSSCPPTYFSSSVLVPRWTYLHSHTPLSFLSFIFIHSHIHIHTTTTWPPLMSTFKL